MAERSHDSPSLYTALALAATHDPSYPRNARKTRTPRHRRPPPQRLPRWYQAIYRPNVCPPFSPSPSRVPRNATPYISSCQLTTSAHAVACRPALAQVPNKDVRRECFSETINVSKSLHVTLWAELLRTYLEVGTLTLLDS